MKPSGISSSCPATNEHKRRDTGASVICPLPQRPFCRCLAQPALPPRTTYHRQHELGTSCALPAGARSTGAAAVHSARCAARHWPTRRPTGKGGGARHPGRPAPQLVRARHRQCSRSHKARGATHTHLGAGGVLGRGDAGFSSLFGRDHRVEHLRAELSIPAQIRELRGTRPSPSCQWQVKDSGLRCTVHAGHVERLPLPCSPWLAGR